MNLETFSRRLESELAWPEGSLAEDPRLAGTARWDSMAVLMVIAFVDAEFGRTVAGPEVRKCATVADLFNLVEAAPARA